MKRINSIVAVTLFSLCVSPLAFGQSTPAAQAARLQQMQQRQAAALARAKAAAQAATATPTTPPTPAPTPIVTVVRPVPTVAPVVPTVTAAPTATVPPKPAVSAVATASAAPAASPVPAPSAAPPDTAAIALTIEALRKNRPERRHAEFVNMQARWGGLLSDTRAADELKLHAQRLAYLQRIRALGSKNAPFVKSVDALITKEETRDSDALNALRSGALPTAVPAAAASAAAGASK